MVLVRNEVGSGSGFLAQYGGQKCLFTNQHVVAGGVKNTFTLNDQSEVRVGTAAAAVEHDIIVYGLSDETEALEVMIGVDQSVAVGDEVAVIGNPDGMGVIHPLTGRIVGIGPQLVEISAEFVPGNSGSPVIHLKTGKVIAVATYIIFSKADFAHGRLDDQVRRFCYRLDSIKKWERVRWNDFQDDAETVAKLRRRTKELFAVLMCISKLGRMQLDVIQDADIRSIIATFQGQMKIAQTEQERNAAASLLLRGLTLASRSDTQSAPRRIVYDHFSKMLATETELREPVAIMWDSLRSQLGIIGGEDRPYFVPEARKHR